MSVCSKKEERKDQIIKLNRTINKSFNFDPKYYNKSQNSKKDLKNMTIQIIERSSSNNI